MEELKSKLNKLIKSLSKGDQEKLKNRLEDLVSVYPFNEYEYIISSLLGLGRISLDDYLEIRDEYIARNMYLYIFEISAPRGFGEQWAQGHLKELVPELIKPSKKTDPSYSGEYDFYLPINDSDGVKIEVKASRAVNGNESGALYERALSYESHHPFWMNFQQIKPRCADVFVWVAVWRDVIKYWIFSSKELEKNPYYSKGQHRGNQGEGQLHIKETNINDFQAYEVKPNKLHQAILGAYKREKQ